MNKVETFINDMKKLFPAEMEFFIMVIVIGLPLY